ncbi:MAG TPA: M20/M25/M40 family metallo-hydrolase [Nitrososphaerales archaeon]|nr:M20/M25/M40 family metallo-hydrolase [Nitrososphaerales archaeon]
MIFPSESAIHQSYRIRVTSKGGMSMYTKLPEIAESIGHRSAELIELLRDLVKIPSPSGSEGKVADFVESKMKGYGFDEVYRDRAGNVISILKGSASTRHKDGLLFNGHIDTVPPGNMHDPFSANVADGSMFGVEGQVVYGRGSSDMKGGVAAMLLGCSALKEMERPPTHDVILTASVLEDAAPGHLGIRHMFEDGRLSPRYAVICEATNLDVSLGNRGGAMLELVVNGRSCHASVPDNGINALYSFAKLVPKIRELSREFPEHPVLGKPTLAITDLKVEPGYQNVVPGRCIATIDTRPTPNFSGADILRRVKTAIKEMSSRDGEIDASVDFAKIRKTCYTGLVVEVQAVENSFFTDPKNEMVTVTKKVISEVICREPSLMHWRFGTDGGYLDSLGITTIGIGPGEERFAHTENEHVRVEDVVKAAQIYAGLALQLCW